MKNFKSNVEFDYKGLSQILEPSTNDYKKTYEKYKKTAKEYNIDLFICDFLANEACIDAANNLKKPVVAVNKKIVDGVVWPLGQTSRDNFYPTLNLTDGTQVQTLSILNNKHPHIHITNFAPQFAVLNHTNTKLFFSHGGAGSSHESLYTGTPMLVLPLGGDQMGNAQKLKTAGVALTLSVYTLNVNDILNKMSKLLEDEKIKKNLKRMEVLTKINSKRKYRAADLIEYILHSSGLEEYINDDYLKEWAPAASRMGFIKANNLDIYGALLGIVLTLIGGIAFKLFKLISNPSSIRIKSKKA
ncbi:Glycosyltransferase Family 1 protein [Rhizophagus diaphanus]|nr:Glycosyltransferase Family 1 protein [Rhizophagus diaphanus] [Rhizophagus sp. MUCL 43196]